MIIWTGDNVAHDIWDQSMETQTEPTYDITKEIMKYFPNTPVYPMFGKNFRWSSFVNYKGNHEAYPADQFDTVGNSSAWLLEKLSEMWEPWLDEQALTTFRNKSYYSMVNSKFNVKIIALDTQVCDTANFYLIRDPYDPLQMVMRSFYCWINMKSWLGWDKNFMNQRERTKEFLLWDIFPQVILGALHVGILSEEKI